MSTLSEQVEALEAERDHLKERIEQISSVPAVPMKNYSVPRVITADELREGDKYAVIWTHEDGTELVDIVQFFPGHNRVTLLQGRGGWILKDYIIAIVLLENAPEPEPAPELPTEPASNPCTFSLIRDEDETGVSGTGKVAEGIIYSDGHVSLRWIVGEHQSTVAYDSIDAVRAIHGHGGKTRVVVDGE